MNHYFELEQRMKSFKLLAPLMVFGLLLGNLVRATETVSVSDLKLVNETVAANGVDQHHHHHGHGHHHHHHHFFGMNASEVQTAQLPSPEVSLN